MGHFWVILDHSWVDPGSFWGHLGIILASFWHHFGVVFVSFGPHFEAFLGPCLYHFGLFFCPFQAIFTVICLQMHYGYQNAVLRHRNCSIIFSGDSAHPAHEQILTTMLRAKAPFSNTFTCGSCAVDWWTLILFSRPAFSFSCHFETFLDVFLTLPGCLGRF